MSKILTKALLTLGILSMAAAAAFAQDTRTAVVQNGDGTYSVIEYPVGKEVMVNLSHAATLSGAKGMAHIIRSTDGTKVVLDLSGVPADTKTFYAYAVDPSGAPTPLGPVTFENGTGRAEFTTPMNQFMVVLSPNESMAAYDPTTSVFWSDVPKGYAIVPRVQTGHKTAVATALPADSAYDVPLLGVPNFRNKTTEVRVKFNGELAGLDGKAYIDGGKGKTQVKMRFSDMKKAPLNKRLVLWASSPDGKYTKLGQVVNTGRGDEGEIRSETALRDFGLMVTVEDVDVERPTSHVYGSFTIPQNP